MNVPAFLFQHLRPPLASPRELRGKSTSAGGADPLPETPSRVDRGYPAPVSTSVCVRGHVKGEPKLPGQVPLPASRAKEGRVPSPGCRVRPQEAGGDTLRKKGAWLPGQCRPARTSSRTCCTDSGLLPCRATATAQSRSHHGLRKRLAPGRSVHEKLQFR